MTASVEASTSHALVFSSPCGWVKQFSVLVFLQLNQFCLFILDTILLFLLPQNFCLFCLRCPICRIALLVVITSFHWKGSSIIWLPCPVPLTCIRMKAHNVKGLWESSQPITSEKNNQLSISCGRFGGIVEGFGLRSGQGKK